jgi:hypothetical protein
MSADVCEDAVSAFKDVVQICPALFAKSVAQPHRNLYSADTVAGEAYMQIQRVVRETRRLIFVPCVPFLMQLGMIQNLSNWLG